MYIYILIFLITAVLAFSYNREGKHVSPFFFFSVAMMLGLFVACSDMLGGYDRYIYSDAFTAYAERIRAGEGIFNDSFQLHFNHEPVFGFVMAAIGRFTINRYIFIFITTMLMYTLFAFSIYKNVKNPFFGLMLFEALLFFFTFAYMRQALAASVCWLSLPYAIQQKRFPFFILVIVAALIHNSAIYFAILWFLPLRKYSPQQIRNFMIIVFLIGITGLPSRLFLFYGDVVEAASSKALMYADSATGKIRFEYIAEAVLFLYVLLKNYSAIENDKSSLLLQNIYIMFCAILLLFCRSTDGGRIAWYSIIGVIALLSNMSQKKQTKDVASLSLLVSIFLYFRILIIWGILLYPYKSFFSNGHRANDPVYEQYEYDTLYDRDKFYNLFE